MKRQEAGHFDAIVCIQSKKSDNVSESRSDIFRKFYKPLVLGGSLLSWFLHSFVVLSTIAWPMVSIYGIIERKMD